MKALRFIIFFILFLSYSWVCPLSANPDSQAKPFENQTFKELSLEVGFYDYHALRSALHPFMDEGIMAHIAAQDAPMDAKQKIFLDNLAGAMKAIDHYILNRATRNEVISILTYWSSNKIIDQGFITKIINQNFGEDVLRSLALQTLSRFWQTRLVLKDAEFFKMSPMPHHAYSYCVMYYLFFSALHRLAKEYNYEQALQVFKEPVVSRMLTSQSDKKFANQKISPLYYYYGDLELIAKDVFDFVAEEYGTDPRELSHSPWDVVFLMKKAADKIRMRARHEIPEFFYIHLGPATHIAPRSVNPPPLQLEASFFATALQVNFMTSIPNENLRWVIDPLISEKPLPHFLWLQLARIRLNHYGIKTGTPIANEFSPSNLPTPILDHLKLRPQEKVITSGSEEEVLHKVVYDLPREISEKEFAVALDREMNVLLDRFKETATLHQLYNSVTGDAPASLQKVDITLPNFEGSLQILVDAPECVDIPRDFLEEAATWIKRFNLETKLVLTIYKSKLHREADFTRARYHMVKSIKEAYLLEYQARELLKTAAFEDFSKYESSRLALFIFENPEFKIESLLEELESFFKEKGVLVPVKEGEKLENPEEIPDEKMSEYFDEFLKRIQGKLKPEGVVVIEKDVREGVGKVLDHVSEVAPAFTTQPVERGEKDEKRKEHRTSERVRKGPRGPRR